MRVLAIRGRNLASLAGDFAVEFEAEPLAGSGIFAITGPTGAGKSTLLDALSLALFNRLPRLEAAPSGAQIPNGPDQGISAGDVRAILRHGTGEGHAEVDFAMPDGARYRARWSVKRARQRAEGRLQNHEHSFERLDTGERMGGTRTETLAAIRNVVGLSAEQFGRAVLLAQGDFEAFIRADANDRALLLERLTGSALYAELGRAAYEKASALRLRLAEIGRDIAAQSGLDDGQRAEAEAELAAAREAEAGAASRLAELERAQIWEARSRSLAEALSTAAMAEAEAASEWEQALPRRTALDQDRRASVHLAIWMAVETAGKAREEAAGRVAAEEEAVVAAIDEEARAIAAHGASLAVLEAHETEARDLAPEIDQARGLDRQLGEADRTLAMCEAEAARLRGELQVATDAAVDARQAHDDVEQAHTASLEWLAANAARQPLSQREQELADQLAEHESLRGQIASLSEARASAEIERLAQHDRSQAAAEISAAAEAEWAAAQTALQGAEAALPAEDGIAILAARKTELGRVERLLAEWRHCEAALNVAQSALAATLTKQGEVGAIQAEANARQQALSATLPVLRGRRDEARRAVALAEAASHETVQMLRAQLVTGEACPVCGASEHRLSAIDALLAEPLLASRRRAEALDLEVTAQERAEAALAAELAGLGERATMLVDEQALQARQLESAQQSRDSALTQLDRAAETADLPRSPAEIEQAIAARQAEVDENLAGLLAAQESAKAARLEEVRARTVRDRGKAEQDAANQAMVEANRAIGELDYRLAAILSTAERLAGGLDRVLADLVPWRDLPDPAGWLRAQAAKWRGMEQDRVKGAAALPDLRRAMAEANASFVSARDRSIAADAERDKSLSARAALSAQRLALLGGEAVAAVEQRLAATRTEALERLERSRHGREQAAQARVGAEVRRAEALRRRQELQVDHARLEAELAAALGQAGLAASDVGRVARLGQAALDAEVAALAAIERRLGERRAVAAKCRTDLAEHQESDRPDLLGEALTAALAEARSARELAAERRTGAELRLRRDDEVRAHTASLRALLERETEAAEVWLKLSDLIGDREGRAFRRFAQGLTLDRLLDHANARLAELKPRYAMERGAGGDMLIQVIDNDMAGEVRGLHNLSGGERFLISLALALGLAEMSTSRGVRIESLFIDEGFGALDPASLGQAISLLEHLHASGRRVGVISHVEELKERIPVRIEVTPTGRGTSRVEVSVS